MARVRYSASVHDQAEIDAVSYRALTAVAVADGTIGIQTVMFAHWDPDLGAWAVRPGNFEVMVGVSSTDIRTRTSVAMGD